LNRIKKNNSLGDIIDETLDGKSTEGSPLDGLLGTKI